MKLPQPSRANENDKNTVQDLRYVLLQLQDEGEEKGRKLSVSQYHQLKFFYVQKVWYGRFSNLRSIFILGLKKTGNSWYTMVPKSYVQHDFCF